MKPAIVIEKAGTDEASFIEAFELMVALHREGGFAPLDGEKSAAGVYTALKDGATWLARIDGKAIGVLSLVELPFWYSKDTYLQDAGFYVRPKFRKRRVGVELMKAAREEGQRRNKIVLITVTSPDRRPKKTPMSLESQIAGFVPLGYTIKLR